MFLLVGFVVHFWFRPNTAISQNELAALNVARMESKVSGTTLVQEQKSSSFHVMKSLQERQEQHMQYLTIIVMAIGVISLIVSFFNKEEKVS